MIHIFPRLEYSIDSTKSPEDIYTILNSVTAPKKMLFSYLSYPDNIEFIGEVNSSDFKIVSKPKPYVRNSFTPVILGTIRAAKGLTVIDIRMRLYLFVQVFETIWYGGAGITLLVGLFAAFAEVAGRTGTKLTVFSLAVIFYAVVFWGFGQALTRIGFYFPAKRAIERLDELLK